MFMIFLSCNNYCNLVINLINFFKKKKKAHVLVANQLKFYRIQFQKGALIIYGVVIKHNKFIQNGQYQVWELMCRMRTCNALSSLKCWFKYTSEKPLRKFSVLTCFPLLRGIKISSTFSILRRAPLNRQATTVKQINYSIGRLPVRLAKLLVSNITQ